MEKKKKTGLQKLEIKLSIMFLFILTWITINKCFTISDGVFVLVSGFLSILDVGLFSGDNIE